MKLRYAVVSQTGRKEGRGRGRGHEGKDEVLPGGYQLGRKVRTEAERAQ